MSRKQSLIKGTLLLTTAGFASRIIGFFYRIFLAHTIGAQGMGIYQLALPVYAFFFAISTGGIQTAITRFTASGLKKGTDKENPNIFYSGLFLSLFFSILSAVFLFFKAEDIAVTFLHERKCTLLLRIFSLSIPMGSIHACVSGYYYALQHTKLPAAAQLLEQIARVSSSYLVYLTMLSLKKEITPAIAAFGILFGELISMIFCASAIHLHFRKLPLSAAFGNFAGKIFSMSMPLTGTRILLTFLHGAETILIPQKLISYGYTKTRSIGLYGVMTGMALPLILFPTALTNAVSVLLLPSVAQDLAAHNHKSISKTIDSTIQYCILLGYYSWALFFICGTDLGNILFKSSECGQILRTLAFLCPFLYLSTTLSSIIHGLGKTTFTFFQNSIGLLLRIGFVIFLIPRLGLKGYLCGLLFSESGMTLLGMLYLRKIHPISFSIKNRIFKPGAAILIAVLAQNACRTLFKIPILSGSYPALIFNLLFLSSIYIFLLFYFRLIHISSS